MLLLIYRCDIYLKGCTKSHDEWSNKSYRLQANSPNLCHFIIHHVILIITLKTALHQGSPAQAAVAEPLINIDVSPTPESAGSAYPSRRRSTASNNNNSKTQATNLSTDSGDKRNSNRTGTLNKNMELPHRRAGGDQKSPEVIGRRGRHQQQTPQLTPQQYQQQQLTQQQQQQQQLLLQQQYQQQQLQQLQQQQQHHRQRQRAQHHQQLPMPPLPPPPPPQHQRRHMQPQPMDDEIEEISFGKAVELLVARNSRPIVVLEPLDPETLQSIAIGGRIKTDCDILRRQLQGCKRRYSGDSGDDDNDDDPYSRKKRRRRNKRFHQRTLSLDELLESPTFKKFASSIEYVFDTAEDVDFGSLDPNDDDVECPPESLISKQVMSEICSEAAKLKSMGVFNQIPADKLVRLLTILQWNVRDGIKLTPNINKEDDDDDDDEEQVLWREITMERVMRSMDASLTAVYIMTATEMPKQVFLEDVIERIILFAKWQLQNTVYPEFDPVYRIDPHNKDGYHGSVKAKRNRSHIVKNKSTILLYNKLCELVEALGILLNIQELTDTVILQVSTLGVSPFFVEGISEMQLNAMKLVTIIFSKYDKHRQLILEDIFASLARLPSSKRNLRHYRLNAEESIQMVTALALQLIQCVVKVPKPKPIIHDLTGEEKPPEKNSKGKTDNDVLIVTSYETAMRTGYNFLSVFLKKCTAKGEDDYRPLFENFVQDLLSTVNKPEWPASELLLSLLGRILVQQFSNKSTDMSLRVASLEYLGIVAARLRKDAVSSHMDQETINDIVDKAINSRTERKDSTMANIDDECRQTECLQKALLDYLAENGQSEPALLFSRSFYIAQWYRDTDMEAEKASKKGARAEKDGDVEEVDRITDLITNSEKKKKFLLSMVPVNHKPLGSMRTSQNILSYQEACLAARYLSSKRPFALSFDIYLTQILRVLSETAVAVRTKAMKCLSAVVEADPGILARDDMQRGVHGRFLDQSTSVREAAVELVGKFILIRPELIPKYYDMLCDRILDTGISVRKRVIKIFKDICLEQPDFPKIPEMCVKMIRRVNDEEGIKKLVNEVFQTMWFTPLREKNSENKLLRRVVNITEVVSACKDSGIEFFEQMLENLLREDEEGKINKSALQACRQIVNCLVENVLTLEEKSVGTEDGSESSSQHLVACLSTLYMFSKIKPDLAVQHAITLQPYLDIKCNTVGDTMVLHNVARILELIVPLMEHPSESFLVQLEEDMMKLILKHGMMVLQSCVSCLGAVVNNVSHNYRLVKDCFQKFFGVLSRLMADHKRNPDNPTLLSRRPTLLRALFTVGLLCRHFDFDSKDMGETKVSIKDRVFDVLSYFIAHEDEDVRIKALTGLGFMCIRHYEYMLGRTLKELYYYLLTDYNASTKLKIQALKNLHGYLVEEEVKMIQADAEWRKQCKAEDLRDMGDVQSGMASTIIQVYLKQILESFICSNSQVRGAALGVIHLVLRQGLIHPVQCVPYLITMGTESDSSVRVKADQQLQEIDKKYPGFIHMKALQGIKMSYRLQSIIQDPSEPVRGLRNMDNSFQSLNAFLYTVLRGNRSHRRALLTSLLNLFDDSARVSLEELLYVADNLAFFPYQTQDEPLFIIHQIDIIVSVSGSNLLQSFKEGIFMKNTGNQNDVENERKENFDDEEEEDIDILTEKLSENIEPLQEICRISQGCILLLVLKQHLKDLYGFTDTKIYRYSPTEAAKVYDKVLSRKFNVEFTPTSTIELLKKGPPKSDDQEARKKLVEEYLDFKHLMLSIDPPDDNDSDDNKSTGRASPTPKKQGEEGTDKSIEIVDKDGSDAVKSKSSHTPHQTTRAHKYAVLLEKKKRVRMTPKPKPTPPPKKKVTKKKRKRRMSDSEEDSDSEDDPDFVA
ncbi:SCC2 [Acanthosepion pharaonis]|uniref:Nipped-B protein n=1 Tax=Acanthosepion pharaonis TaxID=158019 RepID=A0A812BBQ8_ACAPH|nr:SCC2 [Sepia pharaonis]